MNAPENYWPRQPSGGSLCQDVLEGAAAGALDFVSDPDTADGRGNCQFVWVEEISQTLSVPWCCTRKLGHQGQHLASTGQWIAAVHPQLRPTEAATCASV